MTDDQIREGWIIVLCFLGIALLIPAVSLAAGPPPQFWDWAPTPPMGWNSWDCFGGAVTEDQTLANADYMAGHLKSHGWQYIVVDIQWYEPNAKGLSYRKGARLVMDEFGRLLPAPNRFPSAVVTDGFGGLADAIHAKGLKFGVHLLRGIPRQAVDANTPIEGTAYHAADIADKKDICKWNPDMYGVDLSKPGGQEYYDSVFRLLASWKIDFVKVDDLSSRPYHTADVEAIARAIARTGRPIVFSTSPGATPLQQGDHVEAHANMWRISDDFWDRWNLLKPQFQRLEAWTPYRGPGHFPDADMLPIGNVRAFDKAGWTRFTHDEQITMMTLWCMARSPLIIGGNLPKNDAFTLSLLTNDELLAVDQNSTANHEVFRKDDRAAWAADAPGSADKYVALFNTSEATQTVAVSLRDVGFDRAAVHDLWTHKDMGVAAGALSVELPKHGAGLYRLSAK